MTEKGLVDSPLITIWYRPRGTIRHVLDTSPTRYVILLAALSGICIFLGTSGDYRYDDSLPLWAIYLLTLTVGPFVGILELYGLAWVVRLIGTALGGKAAQVDARAALAWAAVPTITLTFITYPITFMLWGADGFTTATQPTVTIFETSPSFGTISIIYAVIVIAASAWSLVIRLKCIGEAHRFSAWRAIPPALAAGFLATMAVTALDLLVAVAR